MRGASNERWCSDTLQIPCWNGDLIELGFILDCHDREAIAHVAVPRKYSAADVQELLEAAVIARLGTSRSGERVQFLSDNGSIYTALDTVCTVERLGLSPVTTPAYSPQSNGMSDAFVNTLRRDYIAGAGPAPLPRCLIKCPPGSLITTASLHTQRLAIVRQWSTVSLCRANCRRTVRRRTPQDQKSALCAPESVSRNGEQSTMR